MISVDVARDLMFLIIVIPLPTSHGNDFDLVDEMFKAYIGHSVIESKDLQRSRRDRMALFNESSNIALHLFNNGSLTLEKITEKEVTNATESPMNIVATVIPNGTKVEPYSKEDFQQRRKLRELEEILRSPNIVQEFLNEDDFDTLTRRFDSIPLYRRQKTGKIKKPRKPGLASPEEKKIRDRKKTDPKVKQSWAWNYDYPYFMNGYKYTLEKNKTIQIMRSIVHEVRYKLVHPQVLRKKYYKSLRYRLGYLFAMLRQLQRQMTLVYHEMRKMWRVFMSLYPTLRLFDKMNRLLTDIKDVLKLIRRYEYMRKMTEDPDYYDHFPSSSGPKWRRKNENENENDLKKRRAFSLKKMNELKKRIDFEKHKFKD